MKHLKIWALALAVPVVFMGTARAQLAPTGLSGGLLLPALGAMEESKICPECGTKNPGDNKFCEGCGHNISEVKVKKTRVKKDAMTKEKEKVIRKMEMTRGTAEYDRKMAEMRKNMPKRMKIMGGAFIGLGAVCHVISAVFGGKYDTAYEEYQNAGYSDVEEKREEADSAHSTHVITWAIGTTYIGLGSIFALVGIAKSPKKDKGEKAEEEETSGLNLKMDGTSKRMEVAYVWKW